MPDALPPSAGPAPATSLSAILTGVATAHADVAGLTGGAAAADVLAALARTAASELAQYFDALSNRAFDAAVTPTVGWRRWLSRARIIRHRVVLVRYHHAGPPTPIGTALTSTRFVGHVLALGIDGELRVGAIAETLRLRVGTELTTAPLPYTDMRTRGVPSTRVRVQDWVGGNDPAEVAPAEVVLETLRLSASLLREQLHAQSMLLKRLLMPDAGSSVV